LLPALLCSQRVLPFQYTLKLLNHMKDAVLEAAEV
jgi:hypothetical protein